MYIVPFYSIKSSRFRLLSVVTLSGLDQKCCCLQKGKVEVGDEGQQSKQTFKPIKSWFLTISMAFIFRIYKNIIHLIVESRCCDNILSFCVVLVLLLSIGRGGELLTRWGLLHTYKRITSSIIHSWIILSYITYKRITSSIIHLFWNYFIRFSIDLYWRKTTFCGSLGHPAMKLMGY